MLKRNLGITVKLAYVMTAILVFFLSTAFMSLANAAPIGGTPLSDFDGYGDEQVSSSGHHPNNMQIERFKDRWRGTLEGQKNYQERWEFRKRQYRGYEEYGRWVRDHEQSMGIFDAGGSGPDRSNSGFSFMPPLLPSFVDLIMAIM